MVVLEAYDHAVARGATPLAEVYGYATCGSGSHVSQSNAGAMKRCLSSALREAEATQTDVDYVSAHATATLQGDVEEAEAIREVLGGEVPVSSLKGHMGHTLGASGAIELIASVEMMRRGIVYPTRNLERVDPACEGICLPTEPLEREIGCFVKNSFAFGGINAALVCGKVR